MPFRTRLVWLNVVLVLFTLLLVCGVFIWSTGLLVLRSIQGDMLRVAHDIGPRRGPGRPDFEPRGPGPRMPYDPHRPRIFDATGRDVENPEIAPIDLRAIEQKPTQPMFSTVNRDDQVWRVVTMRTPNPEPEEYVQVAHVLTDYYRMRRTQMSLVLLLVPFALFVAIVSARWFAQKAVAPIEDVASSAETITEENLDTRLESKGSDELARLTNAFNAMLGRLSRAFADREASLERQRNFAADASHELRTPLTRIRLVASSLVEQPAASDDQATSIKIIHQASVDMSNLVDQLLLLARLEGSGVKEGESCAINQAVHSAIEAARGTRTVQQNSTVADDLAVTGPSADITRAIQNLVQNAVRYSPEGNPVVVRIDREDQNCIVSVVDQGMGIAAQDIEKLGERFYRTDSSRSRDVGGTGLGLAITKEIVHRCGGSLSFESEPGKGTTATIKIPIFENSSKTINSK